MSKIDISNWKQFKIGKLFRIVNGKGITKNELFEHSGSIPAIQSGEENNGCIGYIDKEYCLKMGYSIYMKSCLTVARSGSSGHVTYQENGCVCGDSAKILIPYEELNRNQFLFLRALLMINKRKYHYNDKVSEKRYAEDTIYLPVDKDGSPDYEYMDKYIAHIHMKTNKVLEQFIKISEFKKNVIDVTKFKRFHLYDEELFYIDSGTKLDKIRMSSLNPSINFVGRANANNGVTAYIDVIDGLEPYKAGNLTVSLGGEYLGSCFVQKKDFYTSQNVNVLIPRHEMSEQCKLYIATMIFREGRLHYKAFIDELNRHMKTDFTIPLPVDDFGKIDWDYMDNYISQLYDKCSNNIRVLNNI